ncbi:MULTISPECIES: TonB family protein [unclassified Herbaspirillum]|uniref:TonB family protein n=1 Tax=unclassified Herbaspirillum TaxID=2624150 RepID=UPI00114DEFB2|nr:MULTISPECIES: TonB family protein [unclassified Herbaspirillum]MBB5391300.1 protein TonB [Herbaspirillum sp. SJZ102]TQK13013.1 outer membrane transport energization protein TonB [Herbaspirillum sp. SJZ130]TQK15017.1 outer membrane transport energization protein TonB [Herbaspirillum sp. SJZ106]
MQILYSQRDWIAMLPAAGLVLFLATAGLRELKPLTPKEETPVKLEIIDMAQLEPPKPAPPSPPEPVPPKPQVQPARPPAPPKPAPAPEPATSTPAPTQPASKPMPVAPTPAAPVSTAPTPAPTPVTTPAPAAPKVDVDAEFIGRVRAYLNSVKRYPTGREASLQRPQGTVKVWFVLRRDGSVVEMGIEESSNSMLLDQAARKSMGMGSFPAFPEQFRPGQSQHRFVVDLQFTPAGI